MKRFSLIHYLLFIILFVASFLRLWALDKVPPSLFGDELDVGYHAYSILKTGRDYSGNFLPLHFQSLAEWRTPLYLYSSVPTVALFGISPYGVRLPAAVFGILGILVFYLLLVQLTGNRLLGGVGAAVLAVSPWHIQYSRAGFEVTLLLFLLLLGLWLFFKSLPDGKWLWLSVTALILMPWVYSTAKLFTPLLLVFLFLVWKKEVLEMPLKRKLSALVALVVVGLPITVSTLWGGGTQRFGYISIFTDPITEPEVGFARLFDARARGEMGEGLSPTLLDRVVHNKFTFWGENILKNYFEALSSEFLFIKGDLNLRHSIGIGEFYRVEVIPLLVGLILFLFKFKDVRLKIFILFWILAGVVPSAITREGGKHATRLILMLLPLVFLIAYGLANGLALVNKRYRLVLSTGYILLFFLSFFFYQHEYWVHYPWNSERWWHSGFKESIQSIKANEVDFDKVVISTANEPPWIFFAGWYQYPPARWQQGFPFKKENLSGFGEISFIDKFYFGTPEKGVYSLAEVIDKKTLYLAVAKEVGANLIREPERTPAGLELVSAIPYPSGDPAFYLFRKR